MKFKEFVNWCNERACDGCWGMLEAIACINLINEIMKIQFWKREKIWKENYEQQVLEEILLFTSCKTDIGISLVLMVFSTLII